MKLYFALILGSLLFINIFAGNSGKKLKLYKSTVEIKIDGVIDPVWATADSATGFFQLQPYFAQKPTNKTTAKVLTTDDAVYCIMICYENKNIIQQNTGVLDDRGGDIVSFMIDTFNDKKTAYKFGVSASGVKNDCRLLDDARNRDYNWDGIWFSDAKIYDWGYVIEMKIPYKSIQYDKEINEWGLDFDRWIPEFNEDLYWNAYERNEGQRISKFGSLIFKDFKPTVEGLNLEVYPVGLTKAKYLEDGKYKIDPDAGLDIFYNPSPQLKFQLTANPDFAQIEADPYDFNISRYESYFSERRPFFTEGNEVFMASGKQNNTGFYSPLELFYSRRIGKKLPDGSEVPLYLGTKAFGRLGGYEYGGFLALTGETNYDDDGELKTEERAYFGSARLKKTILGNSQIGMMFVGKQTKNNTYGVLDIDGAFRETDWQLAYQFARSIKNNEGDFAASAGYTKFAKNYIAFARTRYVGDKFNIDQVGYVPWRGTGELTAIAGPIWLPNTGAISQILLYGGGSLYYEKVDQYTDHSALFGFNMQFRSNWGYEINMTLGKSKDQKKIFTSYQATLNSWYSISPKWNGNLYGGYEKTYNFLREYLAFYTWLGAEIDWKALDILNLGSSYDMYIEGNPAGNIEDITYNARPYFSITPINNLNLRVYVDNVFERSSDRLERVILGLLFSYNFSPKSWIYFALNDRYDRSDEFNSAGMLMPNRIHLMGRAAVIKVKYLYYF